MSLSRKWSGGLQESFGADAKVLVSLEVVPERELVDEDGPEDEALAVEDAAGGDLPAVVKDTLELSGRFGEPRRNRLTAQVWL